MNDTLDGLLNPQDEPVTETPPADPATETPAEIPADWVKDRTTGQYRPRKRRGRKPAATPPPGEHDAITRTPDSEPDGKARGKSARGVPRWKAGVIAKGMEKFYRRTGRIIKAMDRDLGIAIIESAEDCGEAWDEVARTNPRIRAFLLKMITGNSWAALVWAHAPIFMAVFMKQSVQKHLPFGKFLSTVLEPDESGNEISDALGGIGPEDLGQMMNLAQNLMGQMMDGKGMPVPENGDQ